MQCAGMHHAQRPQVAVVPDFAENAGQQWLSGFAVAVGGAYVGAPPIPTGHAAYRSRMGQHSYASPTSHKAKPGAVRTRAGHGQRRAAWLRNIVNHSTGRCKPGWLRMGAGCGGICACWRGDAFLAGEYPIDMHWCSWSEKLHRPVEVAELQLTCSGDIGLG